MRVLVANSFYAPQVVGGAELSVQGIAEQMAVQGVDVSVLTTGSADEDDDINGVKVLRRRFDALMPYGRHRSSKTNLKKLLNKPLTIDNPLNSRTIDRVLRQVRPDVVLSNNLLGITPQLWRSAVGGGVPVAHTVRDYALLCPNSTLMCKKRETCDGRPLLPCRSMRTHLRGQCNLVSTCIAPSRYALSLFRDAGYFLDSKAVVIPNAVRFDASQVKETITRRAEGGHEGALRLAYLGRLREEKGFLDLLDAVEQLRERQVELHVAGRGPLEQDMSTRAARGVPVVGHGFLNQGEVDELLQSCDVLVAPSRYAETFGRVVLDAYRNAMPAIVSDAGALPEVLQTHAGIVVPAGDSEALGAAIVQYANQRDRVVAEGILGAQSLLSYSVEEQTQLFLDELEDLVSEASSPRY